MRRLRRRTIALAAALLAVFCCPIPLSPEPIPQPHIYTLPSRSIVELEFVATAYAYTGHRTCTGVWPKVGRTVAVDPKTIPLHSKLIIDGVPGYVAEDTGAFRGQQIDIYMSSRREALRFGRQTVRVQIVKE